MSEENKMKPRKKMLALLVCVLLLSACSEKITEKSAEASGTCGTDLKWYFQDRTLYIRGNGAMTEFINTQLEIPWADYREKIEKVIIEEGCTTISESAFSDCEIMSSVVIPESLTSIDDYAFSGCSNLSEVQLPNDIEKLGNMVFMGCNFTAITIPSGTVNIEGNPFADCSALQSISSQSPNFVVMDGVLFNADQTVLISYPSGKEGEYTIPDGVSEIGMSSFMGSSVTSVNIPEGVAKISNGAFWGCTKLTKVEAPSSVIEVGNSAYRSCTSLQSVVFSPGLNRVGIGAFSNCTSLSLVEIPEGTIELGDSVFLGCKGLKSIVLPNTIEKIGNSAFSGCNKLTSMTIPSKVSEIANKAFYACYGLSTVTIPNGITRIGNDAFFDCDKLDTITIPDTVTEISDAAFFNCQSLKVLKIPDSMQIIGEQAFLMCSNLQSFIVPNSVTEIGANAFTGIPCVYYQGTAPGSPWGADSIGRYADCPSLEETATTSKDSNEYVGLIPGTYLVGTDIPAGTYRLVPAYSEYPGYWKRSSNASGESDSIIANDLFEAATYVTVENGEYLQISRCTGALQ